MIEWSRLRGNLRLLSRSNDQRCGDVNKKKISGLSPYMVVGTLLWVCVLKSGLHATLAGVVVAMFIPSKGKDDPVVKKPISESVTLVETGANTGVERR